MYKRQQDGNAIWPFKKKKKEEKKEVLTPYQKLFKNKKVQTAHGLMTIHKVEDKIYVEFPVAMLGRELLFTSSIENTSDGGEGAPGQLGGTDVRLRFEMIDSTVVARMPLLSKPVNTSGDSDIARALNLSLIHISKIVPGENGKEDESVYDCAVTKDVYGISNACLLYTSRCV